jgi:hypothetical protein
MGTTSLSVPSTISAGEAVTATVQYETQELAGKIPGTTTSSLYVSASRGSAGCASPGTSFQQLLVNVTTQQVLVSVVAGQPGTATFGATLTPGVYSLCAYMFQTFPFDNTPEIRVPVFGGSAATTTVLSPPPTAPPSTTLSPTVHPAVHSEPMPRSCPTVRGAGTVAVVTETGSSCEVARKIVLKLIRKIDAMGAHSSRSDRIMKVQAVSIITENSGFEQKKRPPRSVKGPAGLRASEKTPNVCRHRSPARFRAPPSRRRDLARSRG